VFARYVFYRFGGASETGRGTPRRFSA